MGQLTKNAALEEVGAAVTPRVPENRIPSQSSTPVKVVPIAPTAPHPFPSAERRFRWPAVCCARSTSSGWGQGEPSGPESVSNMDSTAIRLATSPALAPPMPSDTAMKTPTFPVSLVTTNARIDPCSAVQVGDQEGIFIRLAALAAIGSDHADER